MSIDPVPDWSPDPELASLLGREREEMASGVGGAGATARIWHRLEMHSVGAAAAASLVPGVTGAAVSEVASGAGVASVGATGAGAIAWKVGAASMLLLAGGAIGASMHARLSPARVPSPPPMQLGTATAERTRTPADEALPLAPVRAPESAVATVDVESLPRASPPVSPARSTSAPPLPTSASGANAGATSISPSATSTATATSIPIPAAIPAAIPAPTPTSLGEEQRLLDTARAAVARGAYSSALGSLTEHQTRFPAGRLTEERELLFVQALAGAGAADAARARGRAFAERFPGSIFLPAVRAVSASQER